MRVREGEGWGEGGEGEGGRERRKNAYQFGIQFGIQD